DRSSSAFHLAVRRVDEPRMNRTGLLIALAIAVVAGLAFGLYPELDLRVTGYFYGFEDPAHNKLALRLYPPLMEARNGGLWVGTVAPGAGRGRTRDQAGLSATQATDVGPCGRFPDCNHDSGAGLDGQRAAEGSLGPVTSD